MKYMTCVDTKDTFAEFAATYKQLLEPSIALSGESGEFFANVKAAYVAAHAPAASSGRILDFGCGVGLVSQALMRHFPDWRVDGFDVSEASIASVDSRLSTAGIFTSDYAELDLQYDIIVVANVMHHVRPGERDATVGLLFELLSSSGQLFVFEHNPANPLTRLAVLRCPFDSDAELLWPGEMRRLVQRAGISDVRQDYLVFFPRALGFLRCLEPRLRWCPAGAQYVTVAQKGLMTA